MATAQKNTSSGISSDSMARNKETNGSSVLGKSHSKLASNRGDPHRHIDKEKPNLLQSFRRDKKTTQPSRSKMVMLFPTMFYSYLLICF